MESSESRDEPGTAVQGALGTPNRRGTTLLSIGSLNLPEEGIAFVSSRPDGWRFCSSIFFRRKENIAPTRQECLDKIPEIFRDEVSGMRDPATVEPTRCNGEFLFLIDLYKRPTFVS